MNYKVVLEIETESDDPLSAAKNIEETIQSPDTSWQYYVQESKSGDVFSVDLGEEDEDAVHEVDNYIPLIN
jgi:hypothetical protein